MKTLALFLMVSSSTLLTPTFASDQPRGSLLELHSCELYAGGCVVSSESPLGGRYMVRAWNFTAGSFAGAELTGLQVALLQTSTDNLAAEDGLAAESVLYLPQQATDRQRAALTAWIKSTVPDLKKRSLHSRVSPLQFTKTERGYSFTAGESIAIKTAALESCETGACGEALWYSPRSPTTVFTVAVDQSSRVSEPKLQLKWNDAGKRSVFLGRFGDNDSARNLYVTTADLCGTSQQLF
jgi:hypothetical protein